MIRGASTRRRFLAISAAACVAPSAALGARPMARWRGVALGAPTSITLAGLDETAAAPIFAAVEADVARLENIFSLYLPDSELCRLNRDGMLTAPSPEMLDLLSLTSSIYAATGGVFDPTVQPLWRVYAEVAWRSPDPDALEAARGAVGWRFVRVGADEIRFSRQGMAMTLNGIAQGYIADRVAALLRGAGLRDVLVDMGEISAQGVRPDGKPWRAGIAAPDGELMREIVLTDRALATSAPHGMILNDAGDGHILDPRAGAPGGLWSIASVSADRAAVADGLSTAFCLLSKTEIDRILLEFSTARLELLV